MLARDPRLKLAWVDARPEVRAGIKTRLRQNGRGAEPAPSPAALTRLRWAIGLRHLHPAAFQRLDLTHGDFAALPADQRVELLRAQSEAGATPDPPATDAEPNGALPPPTKAVGEQDTPPPNKTEFFDKKNPQGTWDDFRNKVTSLPNTPDNGKYSIVEIFGQEGGRASDPNGTASSGITQTTLAQSRRDGIPGLGDITQPSKLSNEQTATVMRHWLDKGLGQAGGIGALDAINDNHAAAAMADTIYREGATGGANLIRDAINNVQPGATSEMGGLKPSDINTYTNLAANPDTRGPLLDALGDARDGKRPNEMSRNDHFRYQESR